MVEMCLVDERGKRGPVRLGQAGRTATITQMITLYHHDKQKRKNVKMNKTPRQMERKPQHVQLKSLYFYISYVLSLANCTAIYWILR